MGDHWHDRTKLQAQLGISRSAFFRRVKRGAIEVMDVGGGKVYRPVLTSPVRQSHSVPESRDSMGPDATPETRPNDTTGLVPAAQVLALVERYEKRVDAHLTAAQLARTEASELAALLAAERTTAQSERHARQLAALEAQHAVAEAQRDAAGARTEAQKLRARLDTLEALRETPWWAFKRRAQLRTLVGAV